MISICCLAIHVNAVAEDMQIISSGCFVAYVIIGAASVGGNILLQDPLTSTLPKLNLFPDIVEGPMPRKISFMFDVMGGLLFLIAAGFCLKYYLLQSHLLKVTQRDQMVLGKGALAFVNSAMYLYAAYDN